MERTPYYFGTYREAGHYLWRATAPGRWEGERFPWSGTSPLPWDKIDGHLMPRDQVEGEAYLHHRDGWTALSFADRSIDSRHGSHSTFFFPGTLTFDEAVAAAREWFPHVTQRYRFEVTLLAEVPDATWHQAENL